MSDVKESALTQQSDCKWVRALDANGNSIRISKEDLASVVGELLSSKKLYPYMNRGKVVDFNSSTTPGMYFIEDTNKSLEGNPGITYGTLEVYAATFGNTTIVTQVAYEQYEDKSCFRRTFTKSGNVVDWISY